MSKEKLIEEIKQADSMEVLPARFTYKELQQMNYEGLQLVKVSPFYSLFDIDGRDTTTSTWKEAYMELLEDMIKHSSTKLARALDKANGPREKDSTWLKIRSKD